MTKNRTHMKKNNNKRKRYRLCAWFKGVLEAEIRKESDKNPLVFIKGKQLNIFQT